MNVIRYNPWDLIGRVGQDADRRFSRYPYSTEEDEDHAYNDWVPAMDIKEEEGRYLIRADVPGVDAKDLDITLDKGVLPLQGKRETQTEEDKRAACAEWNGSAAASTGALIYPTPPIRR